MTTTTNDDQQTKLDRMRYIKNRSAANLALLAIVFDVLYFVLLYQSDVGNYYYTIITGASVVYNLLFLLFAFLAEEGVKNYIKGYTYLLLAMGVVQIVRIFIVPMQAHSAVVTVSSVDTPALGDGKFTWMVVFLILSAVCLMASAVINYSKCRTLENYLKTLENTAA
ncbi:MAG: hypothetical protein LUE16_01750 [Lachnospiraceae bacterium]|nr:hypothetical protein [Lachnospiraceae bacterium]